MWRNWLWPQSLRSRNSVIIFFSAPPLSMLIPTPCTTFLPVKFLRENNHVGSLFSRNFSWNSLRGLQRNILSLQSLCVTFPILQRIWSHLIPCLMNHSSSLVRLILGMETSSCISKLYDINPLLLAMNIVAFTTREKNILF